MKQTGKFIRVLKSAKLAREMEAAERDPIEDNKSQYIKEINNPTARRNFSVEAYEQILKEEQEQEKPNNSSSESEEN